MSPTDPSIDARLTAAAGHVAAGRFDAALRLLRDLPDGAVERDALMGACHLGRKEARAALYHLQRAALLRGTPADLMALARAHLLAADAAGAAAILERVKAGHPGSPGLDEALAGAWRRDARYGEVIALVAGVSAPSDQMLYDRAMSEAALGLAADSLQSWDRLLRRDPDLAAAWYASHGPALDLAGWAEADRRLERAAACPGANGKYRAMGAVYDCLAGRPRRAFGPKHAYLVAAAEAILPWCAAPPRLFGVAADLLRFALGQAEQPGLVLEFGVRRGASLAVIADAAGQAVHGFDSFEGLPEGWNGAPAGVLSTAGQRPAALADVHLHAGWFEASLPVFLAAHAGPVRFVNIDSDIYSSARTVLTGLAGRLQPGAVLVFDEFIGNRSWREDEYRAFGEFLEESGRRATVLAVNPLCKQVAFRLLG